MKILMKMKEKVLNCAEWKFFSPHIDHANCYMNIRKLWLPSYTMSSLFKLKNDLFLKEERKYQCGIGTSNKLKRLPKSGFSRQLPSLY